MDPSPGHDGEISLDSVIDELLADAALATGGATSESEAAPSGHDVPAGESVETEAERRSDGPETEAEGSAQGADAAPINESLAESLDSLLKEAQELQSTVSAVAPVREPDVPPVPGMGVRADQEVPPPPMASPHESSDRPSPEQEAHPESNASTIQSLDAELAALTDDLLAGEIEAPAEPVPQDAPAPKLEPSGRPQEASASRAADTRTPEPSVAAIGADPQASTPIATIPKTRGPSPAARLLSLLGRGAAGASEPARIALGLVSMPIVGKRSLQQSVGWLASYTLFLAGALWIYLIAFHTPQGPVATNVPSGLHGGAGHGAHDDGHATDEHSDSHKDGTSGDHGVEHGAETEASGGSHGAPKETHAPSGSGSHGSKAESKSAGGGHGGGATAEIRVVNGYAISKHAPAKGGAAKAGAPKDGHGEKKSSGGH